MYRSSLPNIAQTSVFPLDTSSPLIHDGRMAIRNCWSEVDPMITYAIPSFNRGAVVAKRLVETLKVCVDSAFA